MSTTNVTAVVTLLPSSGKSTIDLYTGYSPDQTAFSIIAGYGGYVTTNDNASLELSNNGSISMNNVYIDTTKNGTILSKNSAITVSTVSSGNVTITANTTLDKALDFESTNSDYVTIPDSDNFSFTNGAGTDMPFSIEGWVRLESIGIYQVLACKVFTATTFEWRAYISNANRIVLAVENTNATTGLTKTSVTTLGTAAWHHIGLTYSGSETIAGLKLYLDGSLLTNTTNTTSGAYAGMTNTNSPVEFGRWLGGGAAAAYLDGTLSNWRIYKNRELSAAEILNAYNCNNNSTTNLVGWYKFVDGVGNPTDSSGLAHNATANTADWITNANRGAGLITFSTAVSSSEKTNFLVSSNVSSGNLTLWVNGISVASTSLNSGKITNSTQPYTFMSGVSYCKDISITVNGTRQLYYAPNTMLAGAILPDRELTSGLQNGTITWGTNSNLTITYGTPVSYASYVATANATSGFVMPDSIMPSTWFAAGSGLAGLPFYDTFLASSLSSGVPVKTIYALIIIGLAFFMFFAVIMYTKSAFIAVIALVIVLFIGSSMTIVPMWIPFVIMLVSFAIMYLTKQLSY
jgi:hypothetical protein